MQSQLKILAFLKAELLTFLNHNELKLTKINEKLKLLKQLKIMIALKTEKEACKSIKKFLNENKNSVFDLKLKKIYGLLVN